MSRVHVDDLLRQLEHPRAHLPRLDDPAEVVCSIFVCESAYIASGVNGADKSSARQTLFSVEDGGDRFNALILLYRNDIRPLRISGIWLRLVRVIESSGHGDGGGLTMSANRC